MHVREILRPAKVSQKIFGEDHSLRRLSMGDILELISLVDPSQLKDGNPMVIVEKGGRALSFLLEKSFPTFGEWEEFPSEQVPYMVELIWESNDVSGLIANFTQMAERIKKKIPSVATATKG